MKTIEIKLPERVWADYLDPAASDMQEALGLGEPTMTKRGRGTQCTYAAVLSTQAKELAGYLDERGSMLVTQDAVSMSHVHRTAIRKAESIREALRG